MQHLPRAFLFVFFPTAALLQGCGGEKDASAVPEPVHASEAFDPMGLKLEDARLLEGRSIWMPNCGQCHLNALGGAPVIGDRDAWADRIAQGKEVLYDHAINGFIGAQMNEMPAKGGFTDLSDEQVKLAVDFVVHASQ